MGFIGSCICRNWKRNVNCGCQVFFITLQIQILKGAPTASVTINPMSHWHDLSLTIL